MKKIASLILVTAFVFLLTGCQRVSTPMVKHESKFKKEIKAEKEYKNHNIIYMGKKPSDSRIGNISFEFENLK